MMGQKQEAPLRAKGVLQSKFFSNRRRRVPETVDDVKAHATLPNEENTMPDCTYMFFEGRIVGSVRADLHYYLPFVFQSFSSSIRISWNHKHIATLRICRNR